MTTPAPGRVVTLREIADVADVALSTASRALTNPDRVSASTREHVQAVARRLGYTAPRAPSRTRVLALLVNGLGNPHNAMLLRGAEAQARAAGWGLLVGSGEDGAQAEAAQLDRFADLVDGFLLSASRLPEERLRALPRAVLFNREVPGLASLVADPEDAARQIVEHLTALGHRRVAYLAGPPELWTEQQRWERLARHAAAADLAIHRVGPFLPTLDQGVPAADAAAATGATAVIAFNDLLAIGAMRRLEERGRPVPEAVSVIGFDDIEAAALGRPALTTVHTAVEQAGRTLVDLALGRISGSAPLTLGSRLLVRASTGPAPRS